MAEQLSKRLSRRQFLFGAAGVSVIAIGGAGYWATRQPALSFIETSYEGSTNQRVLVAYGSEYGSTSGVADAVGQALHEAGASVDVRRIGSAGIDTSRYDAAVIGAPVISNEWMPIATDFVTTHRQLLAQIPMAVFLTGMELALTKDSEASHKTMTALLQSTIEKTPEIQPVAYGLFAGAVDYSKMTPAMQVLYQVFSEDDTSGDYRDFPAIRAWGRAITPYLLA